MEIPDFNIPEDQIESFHRYYNEKMLDECKKFEQERKEIFEKNQSKRTICLSIATLCLLVSLFLFINLFITNDVNSAVSKFYLVFILGPLGFGCFWIAENELHELRQRVLNTLYDISILFFGEKFKFISRQDFKEYRDSILFLKNNKNIHILSGISGDYNNIDFKYFHVRQSEGKKSKHTLFYGFVLEFDYPKQFESQTIITKDYGFIKNRLSSYGRILNRVKFENKSFEKNNEVYSDNPDEAKYLLDEVLVEKLRQVTQKFNEYEILFKNQKIIIKVATPKILFDKNIEIHEVIDFKSQTEKLFKDISYVFSLIDFIVFDDNIG